MKLRLATALLATLLWVSSAFAQQTQTVIATAPAANLPIPITGTGAPGLPARGALSVQGIPNGIPAAVAATGPAGGPVNIAGTVALSPGAFGPIQVATGTIGATATNIKTAPGVVQGWYIYNSNAAVEYVQFFNSLAANVTLGTTAPFMSLGIPASEGANVWLAPVGIPMSTAISIAITTTRSGSSAPANTVDYNIFYN